MKQEGSKRWMVHIKPHKAKSLKKTNIQAIANFNYQGNSNQETQIHIKHPELITLISLTQTHTSKLDTMLAERLSQ